MTKKPYLLMILDGWGYREETQNNAIAAAKTPNWDKWWSEYSHTLLSASSLDVGLPSGQMGNSEVGHMNIGAGRVIYQDFTRISKAFAEDHVSQHPLLKQLFKKLNDKQSTLHLIGLLSPGGVHSHEDHVFAMIKIAAAAGVQRIAIHAFLDGRDTPPKSATDSLQKLQSMCDKFPQCRIATIIGRYYGMDRDNRWDRVQSAYELLTQGKAPFSATSAVEGLHMAYARGETDEFVKATVIGSPLRMETHDAILIMNFRADRARQLTRAFVNNHFEGFNRQYVPSLSEVITLTEYAKDIAAPVLFAPQIHTNVLGEVIAQCGRTQIRMAETEKYAHVTFFFNGGKEPPSAGEDRILIPSPQVATYDLQPEMSAPALTNAIVKAITEQQHDLIVCNYANPDMVGHTGNFEAAVKAIEAIDECFGKIDEALKQTNGEALITADHGNIELMYDEVNHQPHTAHTTDLVPLLYVGKQARLKSSVGILADVAPTLLALMQIPQPQEMTGQSLLDN